MNMFRSNRERARSFGSLMIFSSACLIFLSHGSLVARPPAPQKREGMGGVSTGAARVYASRRTAGVTDPNAPVLFEDVTARTALAKFKHRSGGPRKDYILETPGSGVAVFDYDNDGLPDIYLLNGSTFAAVRGKERAPKAALYRNLGNWKFKDVTARAGVSNDRWGMGVAAGDYNNDGYSDLFVGNYGVSRLYRNNGDGTFTDVAEKAGVARKGWSTGASFGDYDGDGRLDLFVPGYLDFDLNNLPPSPSEAAATSGAGESFCAFRGIPVACGPRGLRGEADTLYRQKPDGSFEDASARAGVTDSNKYYGFSSAFVHADDDGLLDILVVNDSTPKQLYINRGQGAFEELGYHAGVALNENGREQAGMGLGVGDYDNDGRVDFYITNFSDDSNTLYQNAGDGQFIDVTFSSGHGEPTMPFLGWGTGFIDYDNDGWKDIFIANGHLYPGVDRQRWGTSYAQQPLLFRNLATGRFERMAAAPGSGLALAVSARGLALGDLDADGRVDAVLNNMDAPPTVLRNVTKSSGHWISLRLVGDVTKKSPRDATGAVAYLTTGKVRQRMDAISGASFSSQNDTRLHFGLGPAARVDKLEIRWPGGALETVIVPSIDRALTIVEGKGVVSN